MKILSLLCREGKYDDAAESLGELIQYFDRHEPKSHYLYYEAGQLFSRVVRRVKHSNNLFKLSFVKQGFINFESNRLI